MKTNYCIRSIFLVLIGFCFLQSCGEDIFRVDYSEVPPPFDTDLAVRDSVLSGGVVIYIIEEGDGQFEVTFKDQIIVKYTGRTEAGEIFVSSYANRDSLFTSALRNLYPYVITTRTGRTPPLIEGFRKGLYGMIKNEKRTIVVPPEQNARLSKNGVDLEGKTLVYDVELVRIASIPEDTF